MICLIQLPKEHGRRIYEIIQLTLRTRQEITWTTSVVNVLQVQSIFYFRNLSISLLPNSKDACSAGILGGDFEWNDKDIFIVLDRFRRNTNPLEKGWDSIFRDQKHSRQFTRGR